MTLSETKFYKVGPYIITLIPGYDVEDKKWKATMSTNEGTSQYSTTVVFRSHTEFLAYYNSHSEADARIFLGQVFDRQIKAINILRAQVLGT